MCDSPFDGPAYLVNATRWKGRRRWGTRELICEADYMRGAIGADGRIAGTDADRTGDHFEWHPWPTGRGELLPPTPCEACGVVIVRHGDPLLKRITCSASCLTSLTRSRNGNKGSGNPCETCGEPITTGRADSRYCGPACRQKSYRRRQSPAAPPAKAEAPPLTDSRGRRLPQRSQSESLRKSIPVLSGLTAAMGRVGELDESLPPAEAAQIAEQLDENIAIIEALHGKLEAHTEQHPHA